MAVPVNEAEICFFDCAVQLDVIPSAEETVDGNLICRVSFLFRSVISLSASFI